MRDPWIINYKRRCYQFAIGTGILFKINVTSNNLKFELYLEEKDKEPIFITRSNNIQILKDLVRSIDTHMEPEQIRIKFHCLTIVNVYDIINKLNENKNNIS